MTRASNDKKSLVESMAEMQKALADKWLETTSQFASDWAKAGGGSASATDPEGSSSMYEAWRKTVGSCFDAMSGSSPLKEHGELVSKLLGGADAYARMTEFWEPIISKAPSGLVDFEAFQDFLKSGKYRDMMDDVFGLGNAESLSAFCEHGMGIMETWGGRGASAIKPWTEALQVGVDAYLKVLDGDPSASTEALESFAAAFEKTFGKFLHSPAIGKDREHIELLMKVIDRYIQFSSRQAVFQQKIHAIAEEALKDLLGTLTKRVEEDGEPVGFNEFFKLWTETNEKAFVNLFGTEEYSIMQGALLDAALDVRQQTDKWLEFCLKDVPVALQSEVDDVYRANHQLRKEVRLLKRRMAAMEKVIESIAPSSGQSTAGKKATAAAAKKATADTKAKGENAKKVSKKSHKGGSK